MDRDAAWRALRTLLATRTRHARDVHTAGARPTRLTAARWPVEQAIDYTFVRRQREVLVFEHLSKLMAASAELLSSSPDVAPPTSAFTSSIVAALLTVMGRCDPLTQLVPPRLYFEGVIESVMLCDDPDYRGNVLRGMVGIQPRWTLRDERRTLDGATRAQYIDVARERWATAKLGQRLTIVRVLADDPATVWANDEIRAWANEAVVAALASPAMPIDWDHLCEIVFDEDAAAWLVERVHTRRAFAMLLRNVGDGISRAIGDALAKRRHRDALTLGSLLAARDDTLPRAQALARAIERKGEVARLAMAALARSSFATEVLWPSLASPRLATVSRASDTLVRGRRHVSSGATRALLEHVRTSSDGDLMKTVEDLRATCTPESLEDLAWDLACAYESVETLAKVSRVSRIPLVIALLIEGERAGVMIRRLRARWPAKPFLRFLERLGTPEAIRAMHRRARHRGVRVAIDRACAQRGVSWIDVLDPLRPPDTVTVDYGASLNVTLRVADESRPTTTTTNASREASPFFAGAPKLVDVTSGRPFRQLPPPANEDDPYKVARSREALESFLDDHARLHDDRVALFTHALAVGYRWRVSALRARYLATPLAPFARRVLFVREDDTSGDAGVRSFRVAEDDTFANVDDEAVLLGDDDLVRLARREELRPEVRARWQALFFDYEIIPLLDQLDHEVS